MKKVKPKDKPLIIDKRDCILDPVPHTDESKVDRYNPLAIIDRYENEGRNILKAAGLPTDLWELQKRVRNQPQLPRIHDIINMFRYFSLVRQYIQAKDINGALCCMAYGLQQALRARIRLLEPDILRGIRTIQGASMGGQSKQESDHRHRIWQDEANNIWKKTPSYSRWRVAMEIVDKYANIPELSAKRDTIYRIIKK